MRCRIRKMAAKDIDGIVRALREAKIDVFNRFERGHYPRRAHLFDLSRISRENYQKAFDSKDKQSYYFVAEMNGRIVGAAYGRIFGKSGFSFLHTIAVHPSKQRHGVGEKLLREVIAYSKKQGCHKISLNTLPVLIPALKLYLKLGFVPEAYLRKQWWKVDFIQMSKWLN